MINSTLPKTRGPWDVGGFGLHVAMEPPRLIAN